MTDNRLRCALAYRLEGGAGSTSTNAFGSVEDDEERGISMTPMSSVAVTCLAKCDYAAQYESQGGSTGALYGGRDKSYADAVALVIQNDPPNAPGHANDAPSLGGFKVVQSDAHQVVYGVDSDGLLLAVITGLQYPSRIAIQFLLELYGKFSPQFGHQIQSATVNSLSKKSKPIMMELCERYEEASKVDKASALIDKVEQVKSTMQGNIATMLNNTEKSDAIATQSQQLSEQAAVFKKKSTTLKKEMKCKNLKLTIMIAGIVLAVFLIIFLPLILRAKNAVQGEN